MLSERLEKLVPEKTGLLPLHSPPAHYLFGVLAQMEEIAVVAAERGAGVEGQLEDETLHQLAFERLSCRHGKGELPARSPAVDELKAWLESLQGSESLAVLNIVCEAWLATVFEFLAKHAPYSPVFDAIEEDEKRHVALAPTKVDPWVARLLVEEAEQLLFNITVDPFFLYPVIHYMGVAEVGKMGKACLRAHEHACKRLGIEPGEHAADISRCGDVAADDLKPHRAAMRGGTKLAFKSDWRPIRATFPVNWSWLLGQRPWEVEAVVAASMVNVLDGHPDLRRTVSRDMLWTPRRPVVGVRRNHEQGPMTVYTSRVGEDPSELARRLRADVRRLRARPYLDLPDLPADLQAMEPVPRCGATLTNMCMIRDGEFIGESSLVSREGATLSVCIGGWRRQWLQKQLWISVEADHRAFNGYELGTFCVLLKKEIEAR